MYQHHSTELLLEVKFFSFKLVCMDSSLVSVVNQLLRIAFGCSLSLPPTIAALFSCRLSSRQEVYWLLTRPITADPESMFEPFREPRS